MDIDIDEDLVRVLAELALIAGGNGMAEQSDSLVSALAVLRPGSAQPFLIQGLARLSQRDAPGAERILRERALKADPGCAMALAYLGLALHQQGRIAERDHVLREALASENDDADAARLARSLLELPTA